VLKTAIWVASWKEILAGSDAQRQREAGQRRWSIHERSRRRRELRHAGFTSWSRAREKV
jgi:hypothetical protein